MHSKGIYPHSTIKSHIVQNNVIMQYKDLGYFPIQKFIEELLGIKNIYSTSDGEAFDV